MEKDVLDSLEDLGFAYNDPIMEENVLLECVEKEEITFEFMRLCKWLTDEIQVFSGDIERITGTDKDEFSIEMSEFLREYGCPYPELLGVTGLNSSENRLLLLLFLTSELQACKILGQDDEAMDVDEEETSPAFEHLSAILKALNLPQPEKQVSVFDLLSNIEKQVNVVVRKFPKGHLGEPLLTKRLNSTQWAQVEQINKTLLKEYSLRRRTLLTRLDVTVRSFQWSELGKRNQDSISGDFQPIRRSLEEQAPVSIADILAARTDLTKVTKTSSGDLRKKTKCAINRVLIGKVPYRGGKPSAKGPPPDMPQFSKRQEPARDQRGHRGGRGGGKGGRGGSRVQSGVGRGNRGGMDTGGGNKGWKENQDARRGGQDGGFLVTKPGYYQHDTYRS
ncbi:protein FAM98A-like [Dendronephthya gigantea]|uniref:protein FAM98A-like n=1 Tax=Dendronephthya gigantea TaxID=151771 RepID=UPI00106C1CF1|nr:protein FAM98A-like [Dendronephthya gigantea]